MDNQANKKANRLINEKSPYLLQHAFNPVEWYPWGDEAFTRAKAEGKPIFLSIGYSTCHWCHVMEEESFEDEEVAGLLNELFIPVKVDREERPDLDQIYMNACQALTGQGGWPLTVFLTPGKKPFFAATYLPKYPRLGLSGLTEVLPSLAEIWQKDRQKVERTAEEITAALRRHTEEQARIENSEDNKLPSEEILDSAYRQFASNYDHHYGGFGNAPKFPSPHQLIFLIGYWKRTGIQEAHDMALETLKAMYRGGIFDQLGYGLHRYSVDRQWLVPHFEKMLYDQATTAYAALEAYRVSGDPEMADLAGKIFSYVLSELKAEEGGFYSAEDADSEGEEGTFYVWSPPEIIALLGEERGRLINDYYGLTEAGNFEKGKNVLYRAVDDQEFAAARGLALQELAKIVEESRRVLLQARSQRERPFRDDKIITGWNGMIIAALARGYYLLGEKRYLDEASRAADFILDRLVMESGQLCRRYRENEASIPAFLEDYTFLARGFIELYRASNEHKYLELAYRFTREADRLFNQGGNSWQFSNADDVIADLPIIAEAYDGAVPSGASVAALNNIYLGRVYGDESLVKKGTALLISHKNMLERFQTGHSVMLLALQKLLFAPEA
ncbi:MAG: thioredoxin domain-containing protein [Bacillota bacterium]